MVTEYFVANKSEDRFFDDLVNFLISVASVGLMMDAYRRGSTEVYTSEDVIIIQGSPNATNHELRFIPSSIMQEVFGNDGWPETIILEIRPNSNPAEVTLDTPLIKTCFENYTMAITQPMFIQFYETVRPVVEQNYRTNTQNWPDIWNFGRVVRNALAHGGEIFFKNQDAPEVNWGTLTYGPKDNGRQILFQDIWPVEIIFLMQVMDKAVAIE